MDKRNFDNQLKPISKISRGWKPLPQCVVTVWERHLAAIYEHFPQGRGGGGPAILPTTRLLSVSPPEAD
jgi:hypothetical protein